MSDILDIAVDYFAATVGIWDIEDRWLSVIPEPIIVQSLTGHPRSYSPSSLPRRGSGSRF